VYNKHWFHGVSLAKYRALWEGRGYRYFGFDSSCVNVFFYDPDQVTDLDHPVLMPSDLCNQQDTVRSMIETHPYWQARTAEIYREI
jgi:hypothetical protein